MYLVCWITLKYFCNLDIVHVYKCVVSVYSISISLCICYCVLQIVYYFWYMNMHLILDLEQAWWQNRFLPVGLKSNLWERQGTPYVYGSSGLSCSGGSTQNHIVGVRTHPHRIAYPTQTHHWASGWHPVTKAIQKPTHLPSLACLG